MFRWKSKTPRKHVANEDEVEERQAAGVADEHRTQENDGTGNAEHSHILGNDQDETASHLIAEAKKPSSDDTNVASAVETDTANGALAELPKEFVARSKTSV